MKASQLQRNEKFVLVAHLQRVIAADGKECLIIYQVKGDPELGDSHIDAVCNGGRFGTIRADQDVVVCQE